MMQSLPIHFLHVEIHPLNPRRYHNSYRSPIDILESVVECRKVVLRMFTGIERLPTALNRTLLHAFIVEERYIVW